MRRLYRTLILVGFLLSVFSTKISFGQEFIDKPFTVCRGWIDNKVSKKYILKNIPKGYSIESKEDNKIKLKNKKSDYLQTLSVSFKNDTVVGTSFTFLPEKKGDLVNELVYDLGYDFLMENEEEEIIFEMYIKDGMFGEHAMIIVVKDKLLTGSFGVFQKGDGGTETTY